MVNILSPQLGLSAKSYQGGEVHDRELIKMLCKKGIKVRVILPKGRDYYKQNNLSVSFLPIKHIYPPHLFNLLILPALFKLSNSYDLVRFHTPYFLGIAGLILKKIYPEKKIVTTIHLKESRADLLWILKNTIFIYDHIFVVSEYLKNWLVKEYKIDPHKITVIYNGIEKEIKPTKKDLHLIKKYHLKNKTILLNLGLLDSRKNILFLVEVFEKLISRDQSLVLFFCGKGNQKQALKKLVDQRKLNKNIFILDPVYGKKKNAIFNLADIFLFPSLNEGFGLVAAEAMSAKKPVIGSDNTSIIELIDDGRTGYLAKTNDVNDWVAKTEKLINNQSLRLRMGLNGFNKAKNTYTWKKVAERTLKVYRDILK